MIQIEIENSSAISMNSFNLIKDCPFRQLNALPYRINDPRIVKVKSGNNEMSPMTLHGYPKVISYSFETRTKAVRLNRNRQLLNINWNR